MIHWTIYPADYLVDQFSPKMKLHLEEVTIDGLQVQVFINDNGDAQVFRVISSNPQDYLRPDLQPGMLLTLGIQKN